MNLDPYELDAKARDDNATRERTAKNKEVQKTQLPHSIPKYDFSLFRQVNMSRLECLTKGKFDSPVISLYINLSPERLLRQKDVFLTVFNSLKHTAFQENKAFIESLSHQQQMQVEDDFTVIQHYLQSNFDATDTKSIALFKSGAELQWMFNLPIPGDDYLAIDPDPYTLPLIVHLDEQRTALAVHVEVDHASFYAYRSGSLRQLDAIKSQVPDLSLDISRPNKVQRHNYEHLNRHFKSVCDKLSRLARRHDLSDLVLIGDERVINNFQKDCLTPDVQQRVIAALPYHPGSTEGELAEQIQQELQRHEVAEEGYYLDMIHRENGRDGIIKGLDEVISAQNRHMIRSLLVDKELKQPGYFCDHDQYISTTENICPMCERQMLAIDNVVDKIVELASHYQVDYKIIRQRQEEISQFGGIAATMYDVQ
jgi:hypothetical protein